MRAFPATAGDAGSDSGSGVTCEEVWGPGKGRGKGQGQGGGMGLWAEHAMAA